MLRQVGHLGTGCGGFHIVDGEHAGGDRCPADYPGTGARHGQGPAGPWWLWIGGVLGAMYVAGAAALTPKLGAAGFLVLVVAGQIITAVLADHYGVMGLGGKPLSLARVAGVVLILCGVLLVQGTWATASPAHPTAAVKAQEN